MERLTHINLNPGEYNQGLHYYQFMGNLYRCNGNCDTLADPLGKICVPSHTYKFKYF